MYSLLWRSCGVSYMKLLVTGGAGFIGSNFLQLAVSGELAIKPTSITVLDSLTYAGRKSNIQNLIDADAIELIIGDICDEDLVKKLVSKCDVIINFAAESHVDNSIASATQFVKTNVLGTQNLLNASMGRPDLRFLQVSTDEVYGSIEKGSWDEECKLKPNSPYSASKAAADLITLAMSKTHEMDVIISRCCNNYGPNQHFEKLIPKLIEQAINNLPLTLYGTGKNIREWIEVSDHCKVLADLLLNGMSREVYNIGSDDQVDNYSVARNILDCLPESKSEIVFVEDRKAHDFRYSLNDMKYRNNGIHNEIQFSTGLKNTVEWYKSRGGKKQ